MFVSARDVWDDFVTRTEIQPRSYDRDLPDALRALLGITDSDTDLGIQLEKRQIAIERFIVALFRAVQPLPMMMSDLCAFLERHAIRGGHDAMRMRFDFENVEGAELSFDLNHFREWLRVWEQSREAVTVHKWTYRSLWELSRSLREGVQALGALERIDDENALRWIAASRGDVDDPLMFCSSAPLPPVQGLPDDVVDCIRLVRNLIDDLVRIRAPFGTHGMLLKFSPSTTDRHWPEDAQESTAFSAAFVRQLETDYFMAQLVEQLWYWCSYLRSSSPYDVAERARPVVSAIRDLVGNLDALTVDRDVLRERLEAVFSLPIWKLRSTVYSAWLITLVEGAFTDAECEVHASDGILNLRGLSIQIITFTRNDQRFKLIAERRVPLTNPIGKTRVSHAQPDYTIVSSSQSENSPVYAVLESKQYRRASIKNFREAAVDYACAHPNAKVVISDYGALSDKAVEKIRRGYETQVEAFGDVHPARSDNVHRVQDVLYGAVPAPPPVGAPSPFTRGAVRFIAIDVSASMARLLQQDPIIVALRGLTTLHADAEMIAVDTGIRARDSGPNALNHILALDMSGSTDLVSALNGVSPEHLLVITDKDGARQLAELRDGCMGIAVVLDGEMVWQGPAQAPATRGTPWGGV